MMASTPTPESASQHDYGLQLSTDSGETTLDKLDQLYSLIDSMQFCMMTTRRSDGKLVARPMSVQGRRRGVDLVFLMHAQGHKSDELHSDPHVGLAFFNAATGEWVSVAGTAVVRSRQDPTGAGEPATEKTQMEYEQLVREYWTSDVASWFPHLGGKRPEESDDVAVAIVRAQSAQYGKPQTGVTQLFDKAMSFVTGSKLPSRHIETRCLATPDITAARVLASASAKEASRTLAAEHASSTISPLAQQPVSLGSGIDAFDDASATRVNPISDTSADVVGYEGPESHAPIVDESGTQMGDVSGKRGSKVSEGYLGPQTSGKLRESLEQAAGIRGEGKVAEE